MGEEGGWWLGKTGEEQEGRDSKLRKGFDMWVDGRKKCIKHERGGHV